MDRADPTRCIFCGKTPTSREHIWSQAWLAKRFPDSITWDHGVFKRNRPEEPRKEGAEWTSLNPDLVVKCVCRECNSDWMAQLDDDAYPILFELMDASDWLVPIRERTILATWATKIAAMVEATQSEFLMLTPDEAKRLKDAGEPPSYSYVWIASTNYSWQQETRDEVPTIRAQSVVLRTEGEDPDELHITTFRIDNLVFQVFIAHTRTTVLPDRAQGFHAFVHQIWPPVFFTLRWPPPVRIESEGGLEALTDSFG